MRPDRRTLLAALLGGLMVPALALRGRAGAQMYEVAIRKFTFEPERLEVRIGDRIRFTNHDLAPHTATALDGSWDTGALDQGQSTELTVTGNWSADYICAFHPAMTATLDIR